MPNDFAESSDGVVLVFNGVDVPARWDGYTAQAEEAGVIPPATAPALTGSGTGAITGEYRCYLRFVDRDGHYSNLSPVGGPASVTGVGSVDYTGLAVPTEAKVVRRQVLRNTAGQVLTFYVDIDTDDIGSTALSSTRTDASLQAQEAVPLFDSDGNSLANRYTRPPDWAANVAFHVNRMWAAGVTEYAEGSAAVASGSPTVTGAGTAWTAALAGRYLHVRGASQPYLIDAVDPVAQTMTLAENYADATDPFAAYSVRPAAAYPRTLAWSEANLPEAWPPTNALELAEDGDRVTGLMPFASFLYVLKRRHVYRVTAQDDPAKDAYVFLSCRRGCVNHRCWVTADEVAYLLDEGGVYAFDGGDSPANVSTPVQPLFQPGGHGPKVNWSASRYFHASVDLPRETARWFVALAGEYLPRHALCYAYRAQKWWVEEYPEPVGSSAVGRLGSPTGGWRWNPERVLVGLPAGRVGVLGGQPLDGPAGTAARGRVTAAGVASLTDAGARFPALANVPVAVAAGRGAGQVRRVVSNTPTVLSLDRPWAVKPDATSVYQVGGFAYRYRSDLLRLAPSEDAEGCSADLLFAPAAGTATFTATDGFAGDADPARTEQTLDLADPAGAALVRMDRHRERQSRGKRFVRLGLSGVAADPPPAFGEMLLNGVL